jgi:sugar lactone lactonase YvrE
MSLLLLAIACGPALPTQLGRPNALALAPDGTLYVSDFSHDRIVAFGPDGQVTTFGSPGLGRGQLWRVYALAVADDGSLLVTNRRPDGASDRQGEVWEIKRFVDGDEVDVRRFDGHFRSAAHTLQSLAPQSDGHLVVANPGGGELFVVDADGRYVGSFGGVFHASAAPHDVVRDGDVHWVVDQAQHGLYRVTAAGAQPFFVDDAGTGPLSFPSAVGVCPGEWLVVADLGNHRVQRFDLQGDYLGGFAPERAGPNQPVQLLDVAVSADCKRLYLADSKGDRVLVTTPQGEVLETYDGW